MDRQVLYANGPYCVVTVDRDADGFPVDGFEVVTISGAALRYENSFDSARDWLDRRLLNDARTEVPSRSKMSPRRRY